MIELRLTQKLEEAGMTAYRLAQLTQIHETQISKLKMGKSTGITFVTLDKLCEALNCEPGELLVRRKVGQENRRSKTAAKLKVRRPPPSKRRNG